MVLFVFVFLDVLLLRTATEHGDREDGTTESVDPHVASEVMFGAKRSAARATARNGCLV